MIVQSFFFLFGMKNGFASQTREANKMEEKKAE